MNGIQEVSGSIPLISTRGKKAGLAPVFFVLLSEPLTSCILNPSAVSAEAGHSVTDALSGSIPLISTKKI